MDRRDRFKDGAPSRAHTRTQFVHLFVIIGPLVNGRNNPMAVISFTRDSSGQTRRRSETVFSVAIFVSCFAFRGREFT
jgi:hypothetical protein